MKRWWSDSEECYCYLRDVQDLLADGKPPYERRFGEPFIGLLISMKVTTEMNQVLSEQGDLLHKYLEQFFKHDFLEFI